MWRKGGKFRRTFLLKVCGGLLLTHLFHLTNAILWVSQYSYLYFMLMLIFAFVVNLGPEVIHIFICHKPYFYTSSILTLQVYSSMSPIIHIVDVGSAETESVANITVWSINVSRVGLGKILFVLLWYCFMEKTLGYMTTYLDGCILSYHPLLTVKEKNWKLKRQRKLDITYKIECMNL